MAFTNILQVYTAALSGRLQKVGQLSRNGYIAKLFKSRPKSPLSEAHTALQRSAEIESAARIKANEFFLTGR